MQLHTLLKLLKHGFHVDNELRAYIFNSKLEILEHDPEIKIDNKVIREFNGLLCTIYFNDKNIITIIEPSSIHTITTANKSLYKTLVDLIGQEITDIKSYSVIEDIYKSSDYISV